MKVLNIGSMNLDYVYAVDHIILPGETEATESRQIFPGGKGMNQSCALAKAGVAVYHCGRIGEDGTLFYQICKEYGIDHRFLQIGPIPTGHTVIQVDKNGQNSILLYGGANQSLREDFVDEALSHFGEGDLLLLQNEVNLLPYIARQAKAKGMTVALNPSPFNETLKALDMNHIDLLLLNEVEGFQFTGEQEPDAILTALLARYPHLRLLLTLGKDGAIYQDAHQRHFQPAFPVQAVDTTAAGDTFTGYFLAGLTEGLAMPQILRISAKAASIAVTRKGAVPSIPYKKEVLDALGE